MAFKSYSKDTKSDEPKKKIEFIPNEAHYFVQVFQRKKNVQNLEKTEKNSLQKSSIDPSGKNKINRVNKVVVILIELLMLNYVECRSVVKHSFGASSALSFIRSILWGN